jgi:3-methyladenine DNA glycosylase AlkD
MLSAIKQIKQQLKNHQNATNAVNMEKYFKGIVKFHGIKTPELKQIFSDIYKQYIAQKDIPQQINLAYNLISLDYGEEKKFGVMLLKKNLKHLNAQHISEISGVIENNVNDWATCDGLAVSQQLPV